MAAAVTNVLPAAWVVSGDDGGGGGGAEVAVMAVHGGLKVAAAVSSEAQTRRGTPACVP